MHTFSVRAPATGVDISISLPYEQRCRSRLVVRLADGEEVLLLLPRGSVLRHGSLLQDDTGRALRVDAAREAVTTVPVGDPQQRARLCYHLGNRHVALQIGPAWLRYLRDHVLDRLVADWGYPCIHEELAFEPEQGAYAHDH